MGSSPISSTREIAEVLTSAFSFKKLLRYNIGTTNGSFTT
jgi:hypothetical protein